MERVICTKDSPVAQGMIAACIWDRHKPYGLHKLGITLHTYADTWAHQGFAGINNEINDIIDLTDKSGRDLNPQDMLAGFFGKLFSRAGALMPGLDNTYKAIVVNLFKEFTDEEGEDRHVKWLEAIREGEFPFGPVHLEYDPDGRKSWKTFALGTSKDTAEYPWNESFLTSDWKYFHDALLDHRFTIIYDILPKYRICAA